MKKAAIIVLFSALLTACTNSAQIPLPGSGDIEPASAQVEADLPPEGVYRVEAWVENPHPSADEVVNISGSLIKYDVYLGGMMMAGYWPDEDDDRLPDCYNQVIYQRGRCSVRASNFPVGVYIPVRVSFEYDGWTFEGETGFTRKD
jgi:hypothetical protein